MISGSTRVFAVIGDPVAHSLSPLMHGAAFRALGLDATYVALPVAPRDAAAVLHSLCRSGGGASVTAPLKRAAAEAVGVLTPRARLLGVCNTVWRAAQLPGKVPVGPEPGGPGGANPSMAGDNTDVDGVIASMRELCVGDGAWLVAGTGGAARAVVCAAHELGARVAVRSRDPKRAQEFTAWAHTLGVAPADPRECHVLVNATPLGRDRDDALPLERADAPAAVAALDLVYAPGATRWTRAMRDAGLRALDGRTMLLAQGVSAFRHWFPELDPPVEIMRAALADALR